MKNPSTQNLSLRDLAYQSLLDLVTDEGINASGKEEIYGCIFGRDSAITILKILRAHSLQPDLSLLEVARKGLLTLTQLQGKGVNLESGEEPGKFIHEFRRDRYEHLLALEKPWYVYPDGIMRIYDSIDATPLGLIAIYRYWESTQDSEFLVSVMPAVEAGLNWIVTFGDIDKDTLVEYELSLHRLHGGLSVQSWTDSQESLLQADGKMPKYPIAPVEAQAYAWLALKLWSKAYAVQSSAFSQKLLSQAAKLKQRFNETFITKDRGLFFAAQVLDGDKNQIKTITGNPLLCLWAAYQDDGKMECIVNEEYIFDFVLRGFLPDMFLKDAGIRTMSSQSATFNPGQDSYHNGSFWPVLNGMVLEGLQNFGFNQEAERLKQATLKPIEFFGSPIELYIKNEDRYLEFKSASGQVSCKVQAWSAASILELTS